MKMMPKPFGFAGWWTSSRSAVPEYMPYTTLRSTRPWALAVSHTPRRRTAKTSRGSRRWIFMSVAPPLDAVLGAAIKLDGRHHAGSIAPSRYGLKRAAIGCCGGQEPGGACCASTYTQARLPEARTTETRRYAATSYLSALWISSGVRMNTVPAIVSEARPVNRTIEWCFFPLNDTVASSSISTVVSAKPGSTSRSPDNRRPNVASWTASSCSVPYEKRNSVLSMSSIPWPTCLSAVKELRHDGEHDSSPPEGLGMIQAGERYKGGVRHVLNALLHPRSDAVRLAAIQQAWHLHRRQDVVQSGSVQLIRREGKKIVIEKLRLLLRGKRREFESQPPGQSLDEGPGIGAIEAVGRRRDPLVRMRTADDESPDPLSSIFRHAPPDPPSHRVPPEVCRRDLEGVEHRHDISDLQRQSIRIGVVRFVTRAMPAGV